MIKSLSGSESNADKTKHKAPLSTAKINAPNTPMIQPQNPQFFPEDCNPFMMPIIETIIKGTENMTIKCPI